MLVQLTQLALVVLLNMLLRRRCGEVSECALCMCAEERVHVMQVLLLNCVVR